MPEEQHNFRKPSILQSFSSYSYYHILVACDSTRTADELSTNTEINRFKRFNFSGQDIGDPNKKGGPTGDGRGEPLGSKYKRRNTKGIGGGGHYVTIIDGSVDADFIIRDVKWATIYTPSTKTVDGEPYVNTVELDGMMSMIEPNGVRFLDVLSNVCDSLGTDPNGIVFLLKTIFVGHHENGHTSTIATVRPLHFVIIDVAADFETTGATYQIEFVGVQNGVGKLQPVVAISKQTNANITKPSSLTAALEKYVANLNTQYDTQLASYATQLKTTPDGLRAQYRMVDYTITVDAAYKDYAVDNMENVRTHNKDGDPIITAASGGGIEEMLSRIMMSSEKVVKEGTPKPVPEGEEPEPLYGFKILSRLDSTPEKYTVNYEVTRYQAPMAKKDTLIAGDITPKDEQVMEFDYIFTGQNTTVLDFKINMNMGMAFFQTLATTNNIQSQSGGTSTGSADTTKNANGGNTEHNAASTTNEAATGNADDELDKERKKTPLFLGQQIDSLIARNNKQPVAAASFREMMNRWAAFENIEASLTIAGSVELMDQGLKTAAQQADERARKSGNNASSAVDTENQELAIAYDVPNYARINIRMPDSNALYPTYSDFWYRGYYVIFSIDNIFEDGKFTQQLEMFSVPQIDQDKNGDDEKSEQPPVGATEVGTGPAPATPGGLNAGKSVEQQTVSERRARLRAQSKQADQKWAEITSGGSN